MSDAALEQIRDIVAGGFARWDRHLRAANGLDVVLTHNKPFAIAPAARIARRAIMKLAESGRTPVALCDRNETLWGSAVCGVPVLSYDEYAARWPEGTLCVASSLHDSDIRAFAATRGIQHVVPYPYLAHCYSDMFGTREYAGITESVFQPDAMLSIEKLLDLLADDHSRQVLLSKVLYYLTYDKSLLDDLRSQETIYWDATVVRLRTDEVVVDGGAYRGDTLQAYEKASQGVFDRYFAFEPDPLVYADLTAVAKRDPRIECVECGLSDRRESLAFSISGAADTTAASQACDVFEHVQYLDVLDLDSFFIGRSPPTFIKMDIEGGERRAIAGASELIQRHRPTLAVSAYHHPRDHWEIPLLIAERTPLAGLFLRHYTREVDDTVCYSIPVAR
jgi:FkbM family methyltransferase